MNLGGAVRINRFGLSCLLGLVLFLILLYSLHLSRGAVPVLVISDDDNLAPFVRSKGGGGLSQVSLKALLAAAIDAAVKGGIKVREVRQGGADLQETLKGG